MPIHGLGPDLQPEVVVKKEIQAKQAEDKVNEAAKKSTQSVKPPRLLDVKG